jgi:hypothetical protein
LDFPENRPKRALCQVALDQLEDEVPGMPDDARAVAERQKVDTMCYM